MPDPRLIACAAVAAALLGGCGGSTGAGDAVPASVDATAPAPRPPATVATPRASSTAQPAAARRYVSLWLPGWNMAAATASALAAPDLVGRASPVWYAVSGTHVSGAGDAATIAALRAQRTAVVPTVTEGDGMDAFVALLADPARRAALVDALAAVAVSQPYAGLDLDFEQFAVDPSHDTPTADRAAALYPVFAAQLATALHAERRTLTVTVMPRTSAAHQWWRGRFATWVYDYAALAAAADRVRVMAYDENAPPDTQPGPVAPWPWTVEVAAYARATMPPGRVELGLPAYGYDWADGSASTVAARAAPALAAAYGTAPHWDSTQGEETFTYMSGGVRHTVWFEDADSDWARARLALQEGFAGVSIWAAGDEDPSLWTELRALVA